MCAGRGAIGSTAWTSPPKELLWQRLKTGKCGFRVPKPTRLFDPHICFACCAVMAYNTQMSVPLPLNRTDTQAVGMGLGRHFLCSTSILNAFGSSWNSLALGQRGAGHFRKDKMTRGVGGHTADCVQCFRPYAKFSAWLLLCMVHRTLPFGVRFHID